LGFSLAAVVEQGHNRQVTTHSIKTPYTKHNNKGHPTTMNTKQIQLSKYRDNTTINVKAIGEVKHAI
jgi:hypothetical protein